MLVLLLCVRQGLFPSPNFVSVSLMVYADYVPFMSARLLTRWQNTLIHSLLLQAMFFLLFIVFALSLCFIFLSYLSVLFHQLSCSSSF